MLRLMSAAASLALAAAAKDRAGPAGYGSKPHVSPLTSIFEGFGSDRGGAALPPPKLNAPVRRRSSRSWSTTSAGCAPHARHPARTRAKPGSLPFLLSSVVCLSAAGSASLAPLLRFSLFGQKKLTGRDLAAQHNVGWHNKDMKTPNADALVKEGIQLDKSCAPNFRRALSPSRKSPASLSAAA